MNIKVFVIIVTYNGSKWIEKCLSSLRSSKIEIQTIVVDNCSKDNTQLIISKKFPEVDLILNEENLGFGKANNIGISYVLKRGADYVFLLNQDAYLQPDTLEKLIEIHKKNLEYGVLSPIHLNGAGDKLDRNFSYYLGHDNTDTFYFDAINKNLKTIYEIPFVNASAWLLPRKTLEIIGGFDPIFFHYAEDDNYCQRVLFHGFKIGIAPNAYICHDREFREDKKPNSSKEAKLLLKERYLKYRWANINIKIDEEIQKNKKKSRKLIVKLLLKLEFKKISYCIDELALLKKIIPEIKKSREINKNKGSHYLSHE